MYGAVEFEQLNFDEFAVFLFTGTDFLHACALGIDDGA